jgi:hypothetical protein
MFDEAMFEEATFEGAMFEEEMCEESVTAFPCAITWDFAIKLAQSNSAVPIAFVI